MANPINSAVVIAKLLSVEGFTDHTANQVERYWKRNSGLNKRQKSKLKRLDVELSEVMRKLTEGEKMVVGRFIGLHKKMSFDTGLKIGIQAFAVKNNKSIKIEEEK